MFWEISGLLDRYFDWLDRRENSVGDVFGSDSVVMVASRKTRLGLPVEHSDEWTMSYSEKCVGKRWRFIGTETALYQSTKRESSCIPKLC